MCGCHGSASGGYTHIPTLTPTHTHMEGAPQGRAPRTPTGGWVHGCAARARLVLEPAVPGEVVLLAVAVVLPVRLVALLVVAHDVHEREPVVRRHEVDAVARVAPARRVQLRAPAEPLRKLAGEACGRDGSRPPEERARSPSTPLSLNRRPGSQQSRASRAGGARPERRVIAGDHSYSGQSVSQSCPDAPSVPLMKLRTVSRNFPFHSAQIPQ